MPRPLPILSDRFYVPASMVTQEHRDAYTHVLTRTAYTPEKNLPKRCGSCTWWQKPWRDSSGEKQYCHLQGFTEYDLCKDYEVRSIKQVEETEIHTYKELREHGYVAFARGDLAKLRETFGDKLLDKAEDMRSRRKLGVPLVFGGARNTKLRPDQKTMVKEWRLAGGGIIRAPTGAGKATMLAYSICKLGLRTLVLANEERHLTTVLAELKTSTNLDALQKEYDTPIVGFYSNSGRDKGKVYPITLATYQIFGSKGGKQALKKLRDKFGYVHVEECLTGDTLIPTTSQGLVRIGDLFEEDDISGHELRLKTSTRDGHGYTKRWMCNGTSDTRRVVTASGHEYTATPSHNMLVLNQSTYELEWKATQDIKRGDLLCSQLLKTVRTSKLKLSLKQRPLRTYGKYQNAPTKTPKVMTPDLAFLMACVVAEGFVRENRVVISNSNKELLSRYRRTVKEVFGIETWQRLTHPKGTPLTIRGQSYVSNVDCYEVCVDSKVVSQWLQDLGVSPELSGDKVLPWSILQADEESQLAFLAAYIECDGYVNYKGYAISSKSQHILRDLQILLNAHGYYCKRKEREVLVEYVDSLALMEKMRPYLLRKLVPVRKRKVRNHFGIPANGIASFLSQRFVQNFGPKGLMFVSDAGERVTTSGILPRLLGRGTLRDRAVHLPYDSRHYLDTVQKIRPVSETLYQRLMELHRLQYRFAVVTSNRKGKRQPVYDFVMEDTESRSFTANGLVSSNCHHASAATWHKTFTSFNPLYRGGSTATPTRKDLTHCVIYDSVGPIVTEGKVDVMPCEVTFVDTGINVPEAALRRYGQYKWSGMLTYLSNQRSLLEGVVLNVIADVKAGLKPLVISERRNFAIALTKDLEALGFTTKLIMGGEKKRKGKKGSDLSDPWKPIIDALSDNELHVVVGTGVMNEAVNIPPLSSLHLPFPSANYEVETQRAGRIRRVLPGKPTPQIRVYTFQGDPIAATGCRKTRTRLYMDLGFRIKGERPLAEVDLSAETSLAPPSTVEKPSRGSRASKAKGLSAAQRSLL